jgi:hypothetical protein
MMTGLYDKDGIMINTGDILLDQDGNRCIVLEGKTGFVAVYENNEVELLEDISLNSCILEFSSMQYDMFKPIRERW